MADEYDDLGGDSGAALSAPIQCSALRKNNYCLIKERPCKIVEMSTSKTGKHGHAKVHLVALDIFTGKKLEDICPSTHNMNCPLVQRLEYQVVDYDRHGKFFTLMNDDGDIREDLKHEEDICDIKKEEDIIKMMDECEAYKGKENEHKVLVVTAWKSMNEEHIKEIKITTKSK